MVSEVASHFLWKIRPVPVRRQDMGFSWLVHNLETYCLNTLHLFPVLHTTFHPSSGQTFTGTSRSLVQLLYSGWTPGAHQSHSILSSDAQGRENITKDSWMQVRTGRDHSAGTITGETGLTWENLFPVLLIKSE